MYMSATKVFRVISKRLDHCHSPLSIRACPDVLFYFHQGSSTFSDCLSQYAPHPSFFSVMIFSHSRLFSFAACCGILNAAAVVERGTCNADNCQRALNGYPSAAAFCASYTTARSTATTGPPTFATQCNGPTVSRLSSACSCYRATASPPTTTGATVTVTATQTQAASTVTATATQTLPPTTVTLPPDTVTLPPDTVTLPPNTVTLPPDTVTLPPSTVTLPAATVTLPASTITAPGTAVIPPPGYSLGFDFDLVIVSESYNFMSFAAVQDPANAYAGQPYL